MTTNPTPKVSPSLAEVLRQAADLLVAHPDLPPPYITTSSHGGASADLAWILMLHADRGLVEQKAVALQIIRTVGGKWEKLTYGDDFTFGQQRGPLRLEVVVKREAVCERVVTGTETVTIPAVAANPERTEEREVVEWRCEPVLAEAVS